MKTWDSVYISTYYFKGSQSQRTFFKTVIFQFKIHQAMEVCRHDANEVASCAIANYHVYKCLNEEA